MSESVIEGKIDGHYFRIPIYKESMPIVNEMMKLLELEILRQEIFSTFKKKRMKNE